MTGLRVDIKENDIFELSPELLTTLLKDHTLSSEDKQVNIFWATDSYADLSDGYQYGDQITTEAAVFPTKAEAENYCKFLFTKFARYLLRQGITSVNVTKECFAFVPMQDFTARAILTGARALPTSTSNSMLNTTSQTRISPSSNQ